MGVTFFNQDFGFVGGDDTPWQNGNKSSGLIRRTIDGGKTWPTGVTMTDGCFLEDFQSKIGGGYWVAASNGLVGWIKLAC